jgi:hypothetical protein
MASAFRLTAMNGSVEIRTDGQTRRFVAVFFSHSAYLCSVWLPQRTVTSTLKSSIGVVLWWNCLLCGRNWFFLLGLVRALAIQLLIYGRRSVTERGCSRSTVGCPWRCHSSYDQSLSWKQLLTEDRKANPGEPSTKNLMPLRKSGDVKKSTFCDMIWYDTWYDMVWYMIWHGVVWYMIWYGMRYDIRYMIWYINCDWVDTRWQ